MSEEKKIRVLIADDHEVVREGLSFFASVNGQVEIAGQAKDGKEAVELAKSLNPDVIVIDLLMPKMGGIEAIELIKKDNPNARILVLSSFSDDASVFAAVKAGAGGYLLKDSSSKELIQAILSVSRGEFPVHSSVARKLIKDADDPSESKKELDALTEREIEVLRLVAQGLTNREISNQLSVSHRTVGVHVGNILGKLNLTNRTQAALYALQEGLSNLE